MGSLISAIDDDMDRYEALCELYGEELEKTWCEGAQQYLPDCYGSHSRELEKRRKMKEPKKCQL